MASSVERIWDSSGWPNELSWPSVRTATSSPRLSSSMRHPTREAESARVRKRSGILPMPARVPALSVPVTGFGDLPGETMSTFITRLDGGGTGPRLAVKDLIDVAGVPTTAGSRAVADTARPAGADAPCMAGARAADARIVGKANLHELAFGATGVNPWFGTAANPLDPDRVPGGSSSGSAVAVATREADVAYGSDTGGSVRIPSACCGTAGLKTTHGRIPLEGVWPLALSLDTIGPMARDVAGLLLGMQLLEPGFAVALSPPAVVGRYRLPETDPAIDEAVDRALG